MACRCDDIAKYENDISVLEEASSHAQKIIDYQSYIDASVENLKTAYDDSVKAPDDLATTFDYIHDGAMSNARLIRTQLDGALMTAKTLLSAAKEEDEEFHSNEDEG